MRKIEKIIFGLLLAFFCFAAAAPSKIVKIPTGLEWLEKSIGERFDDVLACMALLNQNNVPMNQTPDDYYNDLEKKLKRNPGLNDVEITVILADSLYEKEPSSRPAVDRLRSETSP